MECFIQANFINKCVNKLCKLKSYRNTLLYAQDTIATNILQFQIGFKFYQ